MKFLLATLLGLLFASTATAEIQLPGNGLCYVQCNDNDPARSLRLDWKMSLRGHCERLTAFFKLVNPAIRISSMSGGFGGSNNFSGDYSFDDGSRRGLLLRASAEIANDKKVRIAVRLPYSTSFFHIRKRDLVIEGALKTERSSLAELQPSDPVAAFAGSTSETAASDDNSAEARLSEIDATIGSLSAQIKSINASLPALHERLKKAEAEAGKKPKPPAGYMNICPDFAVSQAFDAIRHQKEALKEAQKTLVEMKKLRAQVIAQHQ